VYNKLVTSMNERDYTRVSDGIIMFINITVVTLLLAGLYRC